MQVYRTRLTTVGSTRHIAREKSRRNSSLLTWLNSDANEVNVDDNFRQLVKELTQRRITLGLTQPILSSNIGVASGLVSKWEAGIRYPSRYLLFCWLSALDMEIRAIPNGKVKQIEGRQNRTRNRYSAQKRRT